MQKIWNSEKYYQISGEASKDIHPSLANIKKYAKKCRKILEVGCGEGSKLDYITPKTSSGLGIDISPKAIEIAQKKYPKLKFILADGEHLPFKDNTFDLVYSAFTIEHTLNPEIVIEEMIRVTQKQGIIAIVAPNYGAPFRKSPCFKANRLTRIVKKIITDMNPFLVNDKLNWDKVDPIENNQFNIDNDTSIEPYLRSLFLFMGYKNLKTIELSSNWEIKEEGETMLNRLFRMASMLRLYPFTYWGPHLYILVNKI